MNVLSLFDGMSCGMIALERAGIKVDNYFASEIDKYAQIISEKNYPDIIRLGDVRIIDLKSLPKIDILIGGSPCQSFSFAGKMAGMSTKENIEITTLKQYLKLKKEGFEFNGQSYLFWEYVRILKEVKPKYFLLENVKMLKKWQDTISETLGVEPILINSALVSAQNRNRLYWTNIPNIEQPEDKGILLKDILYYEIDERKWLISERMNEAIKTTTYAQYARVFTIDEKCTTLMAGIGSELKKTLLISKKYLKIKDERGYKKSSLNKKRYMCPIESERLQTVSDNYTDGVCNTQRYRMLGNGWTVDIIAHIFSYLPEEYKLR